MCFIDENIFAYNPFHAYAYEYQYSNLMPDTNPTKSYQCNKTDLHPRKPLNNSSK
jgi:hypothetical protein